MMPLALKDPFVKTLILQDKGMDGNKHSINGTMLHNSIVSPINKRIVTVTKKTLKEEVTQVHMVIILLQVRNLRYRVYSL